MENQNNVREKSQPNDVMRWIQTILLTIITATLIGFFTKMQDLNDRMIRIEERAIQNTENISDLRGTANKIQLEQMRASDRMTKLEYQIDNNEK